MKILLGLAGFLAGLSLGAILTIWDEEKLTSRTGIIWISSFVVFFILTIILEVI